MPCLHKQGTYHRNDFAQDATPGSLPHVLYVSTSVTTLAPNTLTAGLCSSLQYIEGFCRTGAPGGFDPLPQQTISDRRALGSMTKRHAVQGMTERPAEQRLIEYRLVGSCRSVARSHPRSSPAASLNWAGWEDLLPRLRSCFS
ncbi:hypothetical protein T07_392 [Trichinella nelsoni]|uniref:Uncharacterized protein n=1 Tax=Trichinella nelsoni TaxID=6336 RepID=A0A0V0RGX0_9BILA|nr:hypothetical protein T07_392 [Trichinella nelsoni]